MPKVIKPDGIPEARSRLMLVMTKLQFDPDYKRSMAIDDIRVAYEMLFRKPPVRKARVKARPISEDTKRQVRYLASKYPNMHQQEIAEHVGINAGRVSEILNGLR